MIIRDLFRKSAIGAAFLLLAMASHGAFADPAPDFNLPTTDAKVSLASLKGKVVYLDFWASWCTPCKKSFPWMQKMQDKYRDQGLVIVATNMDRKREKAESFLKDSKTNFVIAFDPEGSTAEKYQLVGMPSSYLIDRNGQLVFSHAGFRESDIDKLETVIRKQLLK